MADDEGVRVSGGGVRLYVEVALGPGLRVVLGGGQHHYVAHVMRLAPGAAVRLFNGRDGEWRARIETVSRREATLHCAEQLRPQAGVPDLWLLFAPLKRAPIDVLVEKATELGVRRLQPVLTRRTVAARVNLDRLRAHAVEAAEQSGRLCVPDLHPPSALPDCLAAWPGERRLLFCDEAGDAPPAADALATAAEGPWAVLIGPEGGFTPEERAAIRAVPAALPVSLGPRILRADTAALAALTLWQAVRGDWR